VETERGLIGEAHEGGAGGSIGVAIYAAFPAIRAGLRALLEGCAGIDVVGDFGPERLEVLGWPTETDVALISLQGQGAEQWPPVAMRELAFPAVVMVDDTETALALLGGAASPRGVLLNDADADQLVAAITAAASGIVALAPEVLRAVLGEAHARIRPVDAEVLSAREHEVLRLMALGLPNKGIGLRLGITENTAKFHVGTILGKLGAASRTEAAMIAARMGWLPI